MKQEIEKVSLEFDSEIMAVSSQAQLEELRVKYLGKSGKITAIMPMMKTVPNEQKREMGMLINELKSKIETAVASMQDEFKQRAILDEINNAERIDITLPVETGVGSLHPRTIVQKEIEDVFVSMGFVVEEGYEIETEYNNFDAVNVPANHPARDMQDTFWLNNGQVLKTHTSAAQNRILKKYKNNMPIRAIFPGRCFRNEELDAGHENTFFQLEGIIVDENVSVANLIYFMKEMLSRIFKKEVDVRLRPGFFPFTEPSFEMDVRCPYCDGKGCNVCKQGGWIELCPCGMIHPNVLKEAGIDSDKFSGCAFGLGLDRMVMMKMGFNDIRDLNSGNLKIFKQFKVER
ncbi:MAG: phenylalanine--tRNA ligase subunit alpha [Clostridia bacterium]|nr:phenylalanine--tRNA ligase subunit alpha [Clostridia bacterium]